MKDVDRIIQEFPIGDPLYFWPQQSALANNRYPNRHEETIEESAVSVLCVKYCRYAATKE
jgi:hypothetical protein